MIKTGFVSVTFRQFSPEKIVEIAAENNLTGIEWGGDFHVPPDDFKNTEKVFELTRQAGLAVAAYGSYLRLGNDQNFENIFRTAEILQTKLIRVWAGEIGSISADQNYRNKIIDESKRICDLAAKKGISIVYEFHSATLNDTAESCLDLMRKAARENLRTYWQPQIGKSVGKNLREIDLLFPFIVGVHVFYWKKQERFNLSVGLTEWMKYFNKLKEIQGFALLEFVKDNDLKNFVSDAETLNRLVGDLNREER